MRLGSDEFRPNPFSSQIPDARLRAATEKACTTAKFSLDHWCPVPASGDISDVEGSEDAQSNPERHTFDLLVIGGIGSKLLRHGACMYAWRCKGDRQYQCRRRPPQTD